MILSTYSYPMSHLSITKNTNLNHNAILMYVIVYIIYNWVYII